MDLKKGRNEVERNEEGFNLRGSRILDTEHILFHVCQLNLAVAFASSRRGRMDALFFFCDSKPSVQGTLAALFVVERGSERGYLSISGRISAVWIGLAHDIPNSRVWRDWKATLQNWHHSKPSSAFYHL